MADRTRTREHVRAPAALGTPRDLGPLLFRLLCADHPGQPSARYALSPFSEATIGRSPVTGGHADGAALRVLLHDPYASTSHARLQRGGAGVWSVRDEGSKNGTLIDGDRLAAGEARELRDGDLIEAGHTFFLFRASAHGVPGSEDLRESPDGTPDPPTLCPEWELELARAERLARTSHEILLQGESGAGKEVLARFLHQASGRSGALISINCGALAENLLEDELFGHVKGAFSGAQADREGLVRAADGGTLFLDEVGDMPPALQMKLLRVLEDHRVRPIGSERELAVDLRTIAATHLDLEQLVAQGKFRQDLMSRIGLLPVRVPALRERREDLGLLVRAVLGGAPEGFRRTSFDVDALRAVLRYSWPLNVRELRSALLSAAQLAGGSAGGGVVIGPGHLPQSVRELRPRAETVPAASGATRAPRARGSELSLEDREQRDRIVELLQRFGGNVSAVAQEMGRGRTQVQRWIARFGIDVSSFRAGQQ